MSVRIESEVGLRGALDGLVHEKDILFDGVVVRLFIDTQRTR